MQIPVLNCDKLHGVFQVWIAGNWLPFTSAAISPGGLLRTRPDVYAIRAGPGTSTMRNFALRQTVTGCDRRLLELRTVIARHCDHLSPLLVSVSHIVIFRLTFSNLCLRLTNQRTVSCSLLAQAPLIPDCRVILPSSAACPSPVGRILSLIYLSVCGTGTHYLRLFSPQNIADFLLVFGPFRA